MIKISKDSEIARLNAELTTASNRYDHYEGYWRGHYEEKVERECKLSYLIKNNVAYRGTGDGCNKLMQIFHSCGVTALELREVGFSIKCMKGTEKKPIYTASDIRITLPNTDLEALYNAGYSSKELKDAGFC